MYSSLSRRPYAWAAVLLAVCGLALAWGASALPLRPVHSRANLHAGGHHAVAAAGHKTAVNSATAVASASAAKRAPHTPTAHKAGRLKPADSPSSLPTAVPLYTFPGPPGGRAPQVRMILAGDGNFYGLTLLGGTENLGAAFRMTPSGTVTVLASFGQDPASGLYSNGPLVEGLNADGTPGGFFFGTTTQGGDSGAGTIFLLAPDAGSPTGYSITNLYSFTGGSDGGTPECGLTVGRHADGTPDGYVYGTTSQGGNHDTDHPNGAGVVFRMTTNGFVETPLHAFPFSGGNGINQGGADPYGPLLQSHTATAWGDFFGTTDQGGGDGAGTVFRMTAAGVVTTIHDFGQDTDGRDPVAGLTQNSDGSLFGTTNGGGLQGLGTIYRLVPDSASSGGYAYSQVVSLESDNTEPTDSLIQASDGKMYGNSYVGGPQQMMGSVFRVDADSSSPTGYSVTTVFTVSGSATQGSYLLAGLTQGADGDLYGLAESGGSAGDGTIYRLNLGLPPLGGGTAPQITSVEYHVNFGSDGNLSGGSYFLVHGANFVDSATGLGITHVNAGTGLSKTVPDSTLVRGDLNEILPSGDHLITVTNPDGQSATVTLTTYDAPQIAPPVGYQVNSNTTATVTINGTNFVRGGTVTVSNSSGTSSAVSLNNAPAPVGTQYTVQFSNRLPAGDHIITVTNPDGLYAVETLTTYGVPEIDVVNYHLNPTTNTSTVTVSGNHFVRGGQFTIGNTFTGTTIDATINNAPSPEGYQIVAQLNKPLPTGDHLITVTNPDGQKATDTFTTYSEKGPNITRLKSVARADGSSDLLITGTGFVHTPTVNVTNVTTGTSSGVTADTTTSISVHLSRVLPMGVHDVKVTNPDGQYAQATLTTYGKPRIDGAAAITQTGGEVRMVVSGADFYPGGYNGDISGATVIVRDPSGNVVPSTILAGPGIPATIGGPQQIFLSLGHAKNGQNYSVEIDNSDGQTSNGIKANARPEAQSAGSNFNVYTSNQTQYHVGFFESLLAFFHLQFLLNPSANASPTQLLPGDVSLIDQHPSLLAPIGPGSIAIGLLSQDGGGIVASGGGNIVASGGGNVISNDGGSIVASGGGNIVASGGGNVFPVSGVVAPVGASAGLAGSLNANGLIDTGNGKLLSQDGGGIVASGGGNIVASGGGNIVASGGGNIVASGGGNLISNDGGGLTGHARLRDTQDQVAVSFSLTKSDQGAENGTGPTEAQVYGQDANGSDILILSIRYTPDQPDVITYKAPGLDLTTTGGTPDPLVENPVPSLTTVSPTSVVAGTGSFTISVTGTLFEDGTVIAWNGRPLTTMVLSGTRATAQVPAALVASSGTAQVTVSNPAPGGGSSAALPVRIQAPPALHTFAAGLQMFSVPEDFGGASLGQALSAPDPRLAVWDPTALQYNFAGSLHLGQGYWARFGQPVDLYDLGTPAPTAQPFTVSLQRGWNMIGDPFPSPVSLGALRIRDASGKEGSLTEANAAGLAYTVLYGFPAGAAAYTTQRAPGGSLDPYQGYWIHAFRPCTLVIPAP